MNILFINPPNVPFSDKNILIEPIDIISLATYIATFGHKVSIIDMDTEQLQADDLEHVFDNKKPEVIVLTLDYHIPLHTTGTLIEINLIINIAAQHNIKTVLGGKTATYFPELVFEQCNLLDIIITFHMETALSQLLKEKTWDTPVLSTINGIIFRSANKIIKNGLQEYTDINDLPMPDRRLIDIDHYIEVRSILSSRGCNGSCSYCPTPSFWGNWQGKSATLVADEIEYLVKTTGSKKIIFLDDNATVDNQRIIDICNLIIEKKLDVSLGCLAAVNTVNTDLLKKMYEAGFRWIHYGLESGSERILQSIKKHSTRDMILKTVQQSKEFGFRTRSSWILDLPDTEESDLEATIELISRLETDEIRIHYLALRAGSTIHRELVCDRFPSQYIHNSFPTVITAKVTRKYLQNRIDHLTQDLSKRNYVIIKSSADMSNFFPTKANSKILSFIPLKYGIGW
ncbi:MAG: hypothetical protein DKM50_11725 [Candidatus Margulisiibacteriota bacterium]|nr:MAG: hypothetical protein A2X43_02910 [Candidatus Margulisbacteria bacterium GWD2_39_127]PZM78441.1 MAG: hypothetical protein DKM50_11725 [Candidatus Margulisiibacteriota bacterium]HAR64147.1 hypothetical protein [Candidatus Margulisiibacteriota bacterium]HCY36523.1 hypothetical protein [Candidatus Margulisiibacteriota bacterium]